MHEFIFVIPSDETYSIDSCKNKMGFGRGPISKKFYLK